MTEIERLQKAIKNLHGYDSRHMGTVHIEETFQGQTVWEGMVELFFLINHPEAKEAYAWIHETDCGERRYVTVLGISPVECPRDAVKAYITARSQNRSIIKLGYYLPSSRFCSHCLHIRYLDIENRFQHK